jgi:hypothetical protein
MRLLHRIAERLHCSVEEVRAMRGDELRDWVAYLWPPKTAPTSIKDLFR